MLERIILSAALALNSLGTQRAPENPLTLTLRQQFVDGRKCPAIDIFTSVDRAVWDPQTDVVKGRLIHDGRVKIFRTSWIDAQFNNRPEVENRFFPGQDKSTSVTVRVDYVTNGRTQATVVRSIHTSCIPTVVASIK